MPSYSFSALFIVIVSAMGSAVPLTVSVPSTSRISYCAVTSFSPSMILTEAASILLGEEPGSVCEPMTDAVSSWPETSEPELTVKLSFVRGSPSYSFSAESAVRARARARTVSLPGTTVTA